MLTWGNSFDMHSRREPRFNVQSAVKVAAIDQPAEVSAAVLLDVSGSGIKIISDRDWPVGSRLVVEMENHVVLACVRNGDARGSRFSLGAEKLHSILKLALPPDAPRAEWHRILLAEAERAGKLPLPQSPSSELRETLAQMLDEQALDAQTVALLMRDLQALEQKALDQETLDPKEAEARAALDQWKSENTLPPPETVTPDRDPTFDGRAQETAHFQTTGTEEHGDPPFAGRFPILPAAMVRPRDTGIPARGAPDLAPACDAEPTFDAEPTPDVRALAAATPDMADVSRAKQRWMLPMGLVGCIVAVGALVFYYGPFRPAEAPLATPPATEKPAAVPASAQATVAQAPSTIASSIVPTPTAPVQGTRRATVKASGTNWVSACSDGKAAFAGLLSGGNVRDVDFQHTAIIRVGNAAAAEIYVDGKSLGSLGAPGAVKIVEISGAGLRSLPATLAPETECQPTP
jgi:hypothetical protein